MTDVPQGPFPERYNKELVAFEKAQGVRFHGTGEHYVTLLPPWIPGRSSIPSVRLFETVEQRAQWIAVTLAAHPTWKYLWDFCISADERKQKC